MSNLSHLPARVSRKLAMQLLGIKDGEVFRKVIDANPALKHKLAGECYAKYRTAVIAQLLAAGEPPALRPRCATRGGRIDP